MNPARVFFVAAILLAFVLPPAAAAVVHKWVDADGVTHYSDEAPSSDETPVTLIDIEAGASEKESGPAKDDYYSISRQWQRMHRERIEREKLNLEKARLKAEQQPAAPRVVYVNEPEKSRHAASYPRFLPGKFRHHRTQRNFKRRHGGGPQNSRRGSRVSLGSYPHVE